VAVNSHWQSASDEDWALALTREAVIRPLTDQPELTEALVATASAELGISRSLVYRLVTKFRKRSQVSSLLPGKRGRKATARALSVGRGGCSERRDCECVPAAGEAALVGSVKGRPMAWPKTTAAVVNPVLRTKSLRLNSFELMIFHLVSS
jgi:hypothetical protein